MKTVYKKSPIPFSPFTSFSTFLFPLFSLIFILTSCSFSTEPSKGSLSGTINLEGESDYSSITIALYDLVTLDPEIVSINNEYPQIGIQISQHTEFDHRLQSPVKSAETDTDGSFKIKKIPTGKYNLVAIKDGWGFKYLYNVDISKGDNDLSQQITLFEETHISGNITGNITVETDHHLIIDDDTVFVPNTSSLTLDPGAVIRINPGINLTIYSSISAQGEEGNMFWVTSNEGLSHDIILNTLNRDEIATYNSMELFSTATVDNDLIKWGKVDYANFGIILDSDGVNINNMIFRNSLCGISSSYVNSTQCENVLCYNISNESSGGILLLNVTNGFIRKSILIDSYYGILIKHSFLGNINNNYFSNNHVGLSVWSTECLIEYNEFSNNSNRDLDFVGNNGSVSGDGKLEIYFNNFNSDDGIVHWMPSGSYQGISQLTINNNNFFNNSLFISYMSHFADQIINATHNYFNGLNSENEILDLIFDSMELDLNNELIDIEPFMLNQITEAGIE